MAHLLATDPPEINLHTFIIISHSWWEFLKKKIYIYYFNKDINKVTVPVVILIIVESIRVHGIAVVWASGIEVSGGLTNSDVGTDVVVLSNVVGVSIVVEIW